MYLIPIFVRCSGPVGQARFHIILNPKPQTPKARNRTSGPRISQLQSRSRPHTAREPAQHCREDSPKPYSSCYGPYVT